MSSLAQKAVVVLKSYWESSLCTAARQILIKKKKSGDAFKSIKFNGIYTDIP